MNPDPEPQTLKDGMILAQPLLAENKNGLQSAFVFLQ